MGIFTDCFKTGNRHHKQRARPTEIVDCGYRYIGPKRTKVKGLMGLMYPGREWKCERFNKGCRAIATEQDYLEDDPADSPLFETKGEHNHPPRAESNYMYPYGFDRNVYTKDICIARYKKENDPETETWA